ncbi:hypothetical protein Tco_1003168 [Tanacetum coccineum]|uniref:Uncharacterized protein n=1 Tax=Tanacetum coccineum TaxID=301880 RepID=A0ABQ5F8I2_9ASTR
MKTIAEKWIAKNEEEIKEEGTEAKKRSIEKDDAIKIRVDLEELEVLKKYKAFKFKISTEMKDDRKCFKSCRCKRFYKSRKNSKVDAEKKENGKYRFFVTLDNNQKCYFPVQNLKNLGYEEWKEILLCLHNSKIKKEINNRLKVIVQKLLIQAEM